MQYIRSLVAQAFSLCLVFSLACSAADLAATKSVYLMPMSRGLDQYLAQKLSATGRFQVVTDPQKADAFFTDRIGSNFEESLPELLEPKAVAAKQDDPASNYVRPAMQPLSRGKGNIFLIDRQSHTVIWSAFITTKTSDAKELSHVAEHLANELSKPPKPKQ